MNNKKQTGFPELKKVWKKKKEELASSGQQIGFRGLKGKSSLNSKKLQLQTAQETLLQSLNLKSSDKPYNGRILEKKDDRLAQLSFDLKDENRYDRTARKSIQRKLKKDKSVCWVNYYDLKARIENLRDGKTSLKQRSKTTYEWIQGLKANQFKKGCMAIRTAEIGALTAGFNRFQCTELFICYFSTALYAQTKADFILKDRKNHISHFGFNNSYSDMSWTSKQFLFMKKIINRVKALESVRMFELKRSIHKSGKVFYQLVFKSLNKWSKALTKDQNKRAVKLVKKFYLNKGLDPPVSVSLVGLDMRA